jgi:hypothetical protein
MLPYRQSYAFDVFGNLTGSTNMHWGETSWAGQNFDPAFRATPFCLRRMAR